MKTFVHRNPRPLLTIEHVRTISLGRCYSESLYTVTSRNRLDRETLVALREANLLGYGQEFGVKSKCDGTEEPAGYDEVPCTVVDDVTGEVVCGDAINPYTGQPYPPSKSYYYKYDCVSRCDSGD